MNDIQGVEPNEPHSWADGIVDSIMEWSDSLPDWADGLMGPGSMTVEDALAQLAVERAELAEWKQQSFGGQSRPPMQETHTGEQND